jgi:hypothetical protein
METAGSKQAKRAFNKMTGNGRTKPAGAITKGKTYQAASKLTGHKAPGITKGSGNRKAAQATRSGRQGAMPGVPASTTTGGGRKMHSQGPKGAVKRKVNRI